LFRLLIAPELFVFLPGRDQVPLSAPAFGGTAELVTIFLERRWNSADFCIDGVGGASDHLGHVAPLC
jgi:hypothetical protein